MRKLAVAAITTALLLGTAGCSFNPHPESLQDYAPSEGTEAEVGEVSLHNVLVLVNDTNEQTLLVGSLVNSGLSTEHVQIQQPSDSGNVVLFETDIAAGAKFDLGFNGGTAVSLAPTQTQFAAGSLVSLYLTGAEDSEKVNVPVLDGTLAHYTDLVNSIGATPTPANPLPTPTN